MFIVLIGALLGAVVFGCAQVPQESVELSTTVGRDLAVAHKAHRATAEILFRRIKDDVNDFVDTVYAPYQIRKTMKTQKERGDQGDLSIFSAMETAVGDDATPEQLTFLLLMMQVYVEELRNEIESYRAKLLKPINAQEKDVLSSIDRSYQQMHHANSIVTGHLASIRKVHDAQEELLNEFGIEGLREKTGERIAKLSEKIGGFVEDAHKINGTIEEVDAKVGEAAAKLETLVGEGEP